MDASKAQLITNRGNVEHQALGKSNKAARGERETRTGQPGDANALQRPSL
jgi:hypothetical protein